MAEISPQPIGNPSMKIVDQKNIHLFDPPKPENTDILSYIDSFRRAASRPARLVETSNIIFLWIFQ